MALFSTFLFIEYRFVSTFSLLIPDLPPVANQDLPLVLSRKDEGIAKSAFPPKQQLPVYVHVHTIL